MRRALAGAALLLAAVSAAPPGAAAQGVRAVEIATDNDAYNFWTPRAVRPDRDYTHGMWAAVEARTAPVWGRVLAPHLAPCAPSSGPGERCLTTRFELGQKIFTPYLDGEEPVPGERPYAGWLYASATGRIEGPRVRRSAGLEVGVTGKPSGAEWVHRRFHDLAGFWHPEGWRNQLPFEPGIVVRYDEQHLLARTANAVVMPEWGVAAGNVVTDARAGLRVRLGHNVPHPWRPSNEGGRFSAYVTGGIRGDVVARNLFLDGSTFGESVSVERRPFVGQAEAGAVVRYGPVAAEFRVTARGREYATADGVHPYSSIALTFTPGL